MQEKGKNYAFTLQILFRPPCLLVKPRYSYIPEGTFLPRKEGSFRGRKILYGRKLLNKFISKIFL